MNRSEVILRSKKNVLVLTSRVIVYVAMCVIQWKTDGPLSFPYEGSELLWCAATFSGERPRQAFSTRKVGRMKFSSNFTY